MTGRETITMLLAAGCVLALLALAGEPLLAEGLPHGGPAVEAKGLPVGLRPGDLLTVEIVATGFREAGAVAFHLLFDPAYLEPVENGFTEATFLRQGGAETSFLARTGGSGDRVIVGLTRLRGGPGASGDGTLCRLVFRARAAGATTLRFDRARVTGPGEREIRTRFRPAEVVILGAEKPARGRTP